jgi:hypothetical protein
VRHRLCPHSALIFLSHTHEFDAAQQITMGAATALMLVADGGYSIA